MNTILFGLALTASILLLLYLLLFTLEVITSKYYIDTTAIHRFLFVLLVSILWTLFYYTC